MGLTPSKYPPKKQKSSLRLTFLEFTTKYRGSHVGKSGLKWVAMARHGLKLWENDATWLKIIFKYVLGPEFNTKL